MNITKQQAITIMNDAIQDAIGKEVHKELLKNGLTNTSSILKTIESIDDPKIKENLINKYLDIFENNITMETKQRLEREQKLLNSEIEKDKIRMNLLSNRKLIIFLMIFPILISIILIYMKEAYVFSFFILIMWYGMILALYFSQADALYKLINTFQDIKKG